MMSERIKRVAIIVVTVSVVSIITGCSNVKEYLGEQMKQKSGILETPDYVVFKEYQERGLLDTEGYYSDLMTDTSEVGESDVIDYANVKKMFFKNDILNDSYKVGEELAQRQLNSADMLIKKEFASNERFYLSAQDAAVSTIQCLVRQLNPQNTDMIVEVEFY